MERSSEYTCTIQVQWKPIGSVGLDGPGMSWYICSSEFHSKSNSLCVWIPPQAGIWRDLPPASSHEPPAPPTPGRESRETAQQGFRRQALQLLLDTQCMDTSAGHEAWEYVGVLSPSLSHSKVFRTHKPSVDTTDGSRRVGWLVDIPKCSLGGTIPPWSWYAPLISDTHCLWEVSGQCAFQSPRLLEVLQYIQQELRPPGFTAGSNKALSSRYGISFFPFLLPSNTPSFFVAPRG